MTKLRITVNKFPESALFGNRIDFLYCVARFWSEISKQTWETCNIKNKSIPSRSLPVIDFWMEGWLKGVKWIAGIYREHPESAASYGRRSASMKVNENCVIAAVSTDKNKVPEAEKERMGWDEESNCATRKDEFFFKDTRKMRGGDGTA